MYKALKSFSGLVNMTKNEIKEIKDKVIAEDLLRAGYIEKVKEDIKKIEKEIIEVPKEEAIEIIEKAKKKVSKKAKK